MYDTIIIGAGIAGMTAAIYAARKKMQFKLISSSFGGQFYESGEILNYPGIVQTTGAEFSSVMEEQMKFNNITVCSETVSSITREKTDFVVHTDTASHLTHTVIIATGAKPRKLGIPGEEKFNKRGVTYCSICDGPLFAGKEVAVVGGGDSALEAVDFLKDIVKHIHLVVRDNAFTAHQYLQDRVEKLENVTVHFCSDTKRIEGDAFVESIVVAKNDTEENIEVQGVIVEIGRMPNTAAFKDIVTLGKSGHIQIDCQGHTDIPGIFAAGDCASGQEYQYVIAAGQGCMALIKAARYLTTLREDAR